MKTKKNIKGWIKYGCIFVVGLSIGLVGYHLENLILSYTGFLLAAGTTALYPVLNNKI